MDLVPLISHSITEEVHRSLILETKDAAKRTDDLAMHAKVVHTESIIVISNVWDIRTKQLVLL